MKSTKNAVAYHRIHPMKQWLFILLALASLVPITRAQDHPRLANGLQSDSPYTIGEFDAVNVYNGAVTFTIPLGPRYSSDGQLSYQLKLFYNHNIWSDFRMVGTTPQFDPTNNAGAGWRLSFGELDPCTGSPAPPYCSLPQWTLAEPDGSRHMFHQTLHEGENDGDANVLYTRDGSYLRMIRKATEIWIEAPDGMTRVYPLTGGKIVRMQDRFGNRLTITYGPNLWTISDRYRTHYVDFVNGLIKTIRLAKFGGGHATYTLTQRRQYIQRPVRHPRPQYSLGDGYNVDLLERIALPDGSSFVLSYYTERDNYEAPTITLPGCPKPGLRVPGAIRKVVSPLGGATEYNYSPYALGFTDITQIQPGGGAYEDGRNSGVFCRCQTDVNGTRLGTWIYGVSLNGPTLPAYTDPFDQEIVQVQDVTDPLGFVTRHYFTVVNTGTHTNPSDDWRSGLAMSPDDVDTNGLKLATKVFRRVNGQWQALRSTWVRYTADPGSNAYWGHKRMTAEKTVFHDDLVSGDANNPRWVLREFSDFDGLGHYRQERVTANYDGLNRVAFTNYNAGRGTYNKTVEAPNAASNYAPVPVAQPWLLSLYDETRVTENNATAFTRACFDPNTGFLRGKRQLAQASAAGQSAQESPRDTISKYQPDGLGNVIVEQSFGGDLASLPVGQPLCNALASLVIPRAGEYELRHEYAFGTRRKSYYPANGATLLDQDIDASTGLPSATRDAAGVETKLFYDDLARTISKRPLQDAWTQFVYQPAAGTRGAEVRIRNYPNGLLAGTPLTEGKVVFDGFGRVAEEHQVLPGGQWSMRWRAYNNAGHLSAISEFGFPAQRTRYEDYDPFGRPGRITKPDGSETKLLYTGQRLVIRQSEVGATMQGGQVQQQMADIRHFYDGLGRLRRVREQSGANNTQADTFYNYDLGNRLSYVGIQPLGDSTQRQVRQFIYDQRGFLVSEQHPEKGAQGGGWVTYANYDAGGNIGRKVDGVNTLDYQYDAAERLIKVSEPLAQGSRPLKEWQYASANLGGDYRRHKVITATRHNYIAPGLAQTVTEHYAYAGRSGRASYRRTEVTNQQAPQQTFEQRFYWDDLGNPDRLTYPDCRLANCRTPDGNPLVEPRTVDYNYAQGRLQSIVGWVNQIAYHENGALEQISYANGVQQWHEQDPHGMPRPRRIYTIGVADNKNFDSGYYRYDESGNIVQMGPDYYLYDNAHRLKESYNARHNETQRHTYDIYGNLLSTTRLNAQTPNAPSRDFPTDWKSNHVTNQTYDGAGNVLNSTPQNYTYDPFNNLATVSETTARGLAQVIHVYTADDERIQSYYGSATLQHSVWQVRDLKGNALRVYLSWEGGNKWDIVHDYVYANGRVIASRRWRKPELTYWHHTDHLGSNRLATDSNRFAVRKDFTAFGETKVDEQPQDLMNFAGHWRDPMAGWAGMSRSLDYMHARHYDATMSRFLSMDPANASADPKAPQSWNRYAYVMNNPVKFVDPDGRAAKEFVQELLDIKGGIRELKATQVPVGQLVDRAGNQITRSITSDRMFFGGKSFLGDMKTLLGNPATRQAGKAALKKAGGLVSEAFGLGYAIGTAIENKTHAGEKAVDFYVDKAVHKKGDKTDAQMEAAREKMHDAVEQKRQQESSTTPDGTKDKNSPVG
jgi:RHS repeat-associated protein